MRETFFYVIVILTLLFALILSALPLPETARTFWPEWVLLTVIYWCLVAPNRLNITFAWLTGISMDLLNGYIIGQHALAYSLVAAATVYFHKRLRSYPMTQQSFSVGALLLACFFIKAWIDGMMYPDVLNWKQWMPILTSIVAWPWVFFMLRLMRYRVPSID